MKIIIIGTAHPYRGGLAAFNERLANEFVGQGHEVEICTFTLQYPSFLFPGTTQYADEPAPANLKISRKINSVNPLNWLKVGCEIRKKQPDLLVFCYWMSFMAPCFGTIARRAKTANIKAIALIHNMLPHEKGILDKIFPNYFVQAMDGFVAMTDSVVNDINKFDKQNKPKTVSPHPIYDHFGEKISRHEALNYLQLDENQRYMLFFGFIRDYKGLDLLLRAYADSRFRQLNVKLLVAGEFYNNADQYFALENELGLKDEIIWANNFIPDGEVRYYFSAADIIVQPYKAATQSGVTQIAYYFEKPMLVTNVGGLAEMVPDGKVGYVTAPQENDIAEALLNFFGKKKENAFLENIKAEKEKYSWGKMTNAVLETSRQVNE
jgi:glycosyltransferase involved in cell wall biosynthesis